MYTNEKHAQILLSLLKAHGIKKIVISPGSTNIPISGSVQSDQFFEVYSSVDERSAAYMACGLAEKSGETVVISCTGATASRNYLSGLTEAYYRKLPIVAVTSFNGNQNIGHLVPQNIDRTAIQNDVAKISVHLPVVKDDTDEWYCNILINKALLATQKDGGGPVHINIESTYTGVFDVNELPIQRAITRYTSEDDLPTIENKKIGIFIGSHKTFNKSEVEAIENFCKKRNSIVICDHTSSYYGKYRIQSALIASNYGLLNPVWKELRPEVVIHLGEVSGDYPSSRVLSEANEVWRVSLDGEVRDTGKKLKYIFYGAEKTFFEKIGEGNDENNYYSLWSIKDKELRELIPDLPFSNLYVASILSNKIPDCSHLYLGILNSLRSWNYFNVNNSVKISCNVGGFGIDGCLSTALGGSLVDPDNLHFVVLGDLAFFYDINSLANRHLGNNIRIILVNNGCGVEFNNSSHIASQFGCIANDYIAAGGHFNSGERGGSQPLPSEKRKELSLAKAWCESSGFKYYAALSKGEFDNLVDKFLSTNITSPIIIECFTDVADESCALEIMTSLKRSGLEKIAMKAKKAIPRTVANKAKSFLLGKK